MVLFPVDGSGVHYNPSFLTELPFPCGLGPSVSGPCQESLHRYFFDAETETCEAFVYGGCGGNANNFLTLQDCNDKCNPSINPQQRCNQPRNPVNTLHCLSIKKKSGSKRMRNKSQRFAKYSLMMNVSANVSDLSSEGLLKDNPRRALISVLGLLTNVARIRCFSLKFWLLSKKLKTHLRALNEGSIFPESLFNVFSHWP